MVNTVQWSHPQRAVVSNKNHLPMLPVKQLQQLWQEEQVEEVQSYHCSLPVFNHCSPSCPKRSWRNWLQLFLVFEGRPLVVVLEQLLLPALQVSLPQTKAP